MSSDSGTLILLITAALGGGASSQIVLGLIKSRAERRKLSTESLVDESTVGVNYNAVADALITQLQQDSETYRGIVKELQAEVERLRERHEAAQRAWVEELQAAHAEHSRLTTRIAQVSNDLDICVRQSEELRAASRRTDGRRKP